MDSANSGSLQSSSGGDDDFDSLSALFRSSYSSSAPSAAAAAEILLPSSSSNHHHFFDAAYLDSSSLLPFETATSALATETASWSRAGWRPTLSVQPQDVPAADAAVSTQRSSKKRSRASRRTPTTVLTTDTTNFRAMVQEFTGIPSAPFAFHSPAGSAFRSLSASVTAAAPPYLLRPLAQKVQNPAATNGASTAATVSSMFIANANVSIPIDTSAIRGPNQPLLSSQTPMLSFQSVLQPHLHAKHAQPFPQTMPSTSSEYGGFAPSTVSSSQIIDLRSSWNATAPAISADQLQLRSISGEPVGLRHQKIANTCKMNLSALGSSPEFDAENVAESSRASRGEGTLEPWICSSD